MKETKPLKSISILGCGWLGWPLARRLVQQGYSVKGSTTSVGKLKALQEDGIVPFLIELAEGNDQKALSQFLQSDLLIINYPPGIRKNGIEQFHDSFNRLLTKLKDSEVREIIFVSSTSVYPNTNRLVDENETQAPDTASGIALLQAEKQLIGLGNQSSTILRMAGLIGYDRQPGRFFAGKKGLANSHEVVNLIHRDDCLRIIEAIISKGTISGVFNCCSDTHPLKHEFYKKAAEIVGLEAPIFEQDSSAKYKIVANQKLKKELNYEYLYGDLARFDWP